MYPNALIGSPRDRTAVAVNVAANGSVAVSDVGSAPIFGVDGRLLAVLDVSAIDPGLSERAHALTGALTVNSARAVEERLFREHFRHDWVIAIASPEEDASGTLLAVDGDRNPNSRA